MKALLLILIALLPYALNAQQATADTTKPKWEMMSFWFVMLEKGQNRSQDSVTVEKLQAGHMANMEKMHAAGKLLLAGPFTDDGFWRGIFIIKANSREEVEALLKGDPAIAAGRMKYEIHTWMTAKNCLLN